MALRQDARMARNNLSVTMCRSKLGGLCARGWYAAGAQQSGRWLTEVPSPQALALEQVVLVAEAHHLHHLWAVLC